jgi:hypothetical protein
MAVLREAADRAKAQMNEVIRLLKSNPPDLEQAKRIKWCKETLIALATNRLHLYKENSERLEAAIEKAKRE